MRVYTYTSFSLVAIDKHFDQKSSTLGVGLTSAIMEGTVTLRKFILPVTAIHEDQLATIQDLKEESRNPVAEE